jgi:GxxExxY protein
MTKVSLNNLAYSVFGAIIEVHRNLGPGLLESVYHKCLIHELNLRSIKCESEQIVPIEYKGLQLESELRCDILVENCIVLELKSVKELLPVFDAQLLTYMKLTKSPKGILINFNCKNIYDEGSKTLVNEFFTILK